MPAIGLKNCLKITKTLFI